MRHLGLRVGGMGCRRCVREVTARLRDVAGVDTVVADVQRSQILLGGSMTVEDVVAAFAGTTYAMTLLEPNGHDGAPGHDSTPNGHDSAGTPVGQPGT
jgi:copper chaperone CopZ